MSKPPPPEEASEASLAIRLPLDAAWDALEGLDLNRHREDLVENTRRAQDKRTWSATHREDPKYPGARVREESATSTLAECALPLADMVEAMRPDAAHGEKFRQGRPRRARGELTKAVGWIRDNLRDNLKCFNLYTALEVLEKKEVVEGLFEEGKIGITRVNVDFERGRVYYRTRSGKERSVGFTRIDNIINDR
jgi:hypothetical protein